MNITVNSEGYISRITTESGMIFVSVNWKTKPKKLMFRKFGFRKGATPEDLRKLAKELQDVANVLEASIAN